MRILHLLSGGGIGGIEVLCKDIERYSENENEFVFLFSGGEIIGELEKNGGKVSRLYQVRNRLVRGKKLVNLVRKRDYDVIITHHGSLGMFLYYIFLMWKFPNKIYVKYLHSAFDKNDYYKNNVLYARLVKWSLEYIFSHSAHIIAVSEYVKNSFLDEFICDEKKISVVYNGIEVKKSEKKKENEGISTLLYIGRLEIVKGVQLLIEATNILCKDYNFNVIIVGAGSYEKELKRLVAEYALGNRICFFPATLNKEKFFQKADIFVYPSICQEAFGISVVEAMNHRMICVVSESGGIPEIIKDNQNGLIFSLGDEQALALCIERVLKMNEKDKEYICNNAYLTSKNFSIKRTVAELEKTYCI